MGLQVEGALQVEESLQVPSPWPVSLKGGGRMPDVD